MNKELQRIKIAEACGWKFIPEYCHGEDQPPEFTTVTPDGRHLCGYYPDYLNDLNDMHEAEELCGEVFSIKSWEYHDWLSCVIGHDQTWRATAAQRAEAFLKNLGLWEEEACNESISIMNKVEKIAEKIGAEITKVPTDDGWQIEVTAPEGFGWGGVGTLIAHYGGTWGNIGKAWEDLSERMTMELTPKQ